MKQPRNIYEQVNLQTTWLNLGANVIGAVISFLFFSVIFPLPETQTVREVDQLNALFFMFITAVLLFIGFYLFSGSEKRLREW